MSLQSRHARTVTIRVNHVFGERSPSPPPWVERKISSGTSSKADKKTRGNLPKTPQDNRIIRNHCGNRPWSNMLSRSRTSQNIQVGDGSGRHGQNGGAGGAFGHVCLEMVVSPSSNGNGRRLMKSNQIISRSTQTRSPCCCVKELLRPASSPSISSNSKVANSVNMSPLLNFNPHKVNNSCANIEHRRTPDQSSRDKLQIRNFHNARAAFCRSS